MYKSLIETFWLFVGLKFSRKDKHSEICETHN